MPSQFWFGSLEQWAGVRADESTGGLRGLACAPPECLIMAKHQTLRLYCVARWVGYEIPGRSATVQVRSCCFIWALSRETH